MLDRVFMENDKGAMLNLRQHNENGQKYVSWVFRYNGHMKSWTVDGDIKTSVKLWKEKGFKVK